jgi:hypothetical protein
VCTTSYFGFGQVTQLWCVIDEKQEMTVKRKRNRAAWRAMAAKKVVR